MSSLRPTQQWRRLVKLLGDHKHHYLRFGTSAAVEGGHQQHHQQHWRGRQEHGTALSTTFPDDSAWPQCPRIGHAEAAGLRAWQPPLDSLPMPVRDKSVLDRSAVRGPSSDAAQAQYPAAIGRSVTAVAPCRFYSSSSSSSDSLSSSSSSHAQGETQADLLGKSAAPSETLASIQQGLVDLLSDSPDAGANNKSTVVSNAKRRTEELAALCLQLKPENVQALDHSQVAAVLAAMAAVHQCSARTSFGSSLGELQSLYRELLARAFATVPDMEGNDILRALTSLVHIEFEAASTFLSKASWRIRQLHGRGSMAVREVADILEAAAAAGRTLDGHVSSEALALFSVMQHSLAAGAESLSALQVLHLASVVRSCGIGGPGSPGSSLKKLDKALRKETMRRMGSFAPLEVAEALRLFTTPGRQAEGRGSVGNSPELMAAAQRRLAYTAGSLGGLPVHELASLLGHLGACDFVPHDKVFQAVENRLVELASRAPEATAKAGIRQQHEFRLSDLAKLTYSSASLGWQGEELYRAVQELWMSHRKQRPGSKGTLPPHIVARMAWGMAVPGLLDRGYFSELVAELPADPGAFKPHELNMLFQAELSLHEGAEVLPPLLRAVAKRSWQSSAVNTAGTSPLLRLVRRLVRELGAEPVSEHLTEDGCLSIDLAIPLAAPSDPGGVSPTCGVAVEINGPSHYASNVIRRELGRTVLRRRLLEARGWRVASIPHYELTGSTAQGRAARLRSLLKLHLRDYAR